MAITLYFCSNAFFSGNAQQSIETGERWINHTSLKHGFSIMVPADAELVEGKNSIFDEDQRLKITKDDMWAFRVVEYPLKEYPTTLEEWAKMHTDNLAKDKNEFDNVHPILIWSLNKTKVDNEPAYLSVISNVDDNTGISKYVGLLYFFFHNENKYILIQTVEPNLYEQSKAERDKMINSIRFLK